MQPSIPIVNFEPFWSGSATTQQAIATQIDRACREVGFFYLSNSGLPETLVARQFEQSRALFALPLAAKQQLAWTSAASNRGYGSLGREQLDPTGAGDHKETFNLGRELDELPIELQNAWPQQLPEFRATAIEFFAACVQVAEVVLRSIALALNLPIEFFVARHSEQAHTLRLLHYPPLPAHLPARDRAGVHTDYGSITLLFQGGDGLEVQTVSGTWIAVPPLADMVVVNLGDLMQRWTNDEYRSTPHRVRAGATPRQSIAFFCDPNPDVEIACLTGLSDRSQSEPARYAPISAAAYLRSRLQRTYR